MLLAPPSLVLATALACAHKPEGPAATLQEFGAALARNDCGRAYALTSADFQKRTPYDAFAAGLGANPADTKAYGKRVGDEAARVAPRVDLQLPQGETVDAGARGRPLARRRARARPWGQRTPRAALRTFVRALGERRYDIVLRLVPRRHRVDLTADKLRQYWEAHQDETRGLLTRLQAALAAPIVEIGRRGPHALRPGAGSGLRARGRRLANRGSRTDWAGRCVTLIRASGWALPPLTFRPRDAELD